MLALSITVAQKCVKVEGWVQERDKEQGSAG